MSQNKNKGTKMNKVLAGTGTLGGILLTSYFYKSIETPLHYITIIFAGLFGIYGFAENLQNLVNQIRNQNQSNKLIVFSSYFISACLIIGIITFAAKVEIIDKIKSY